MGRRRSSAGSQQAVSAALNLFHRLPGPLKGVVVVLAVLGVVVFFLTQYRPGPQATVADGENEFLFCFWNVENLFDDQDDKRNRIDDPYDDPFAQNAALRELKYDRIASTLLGMNGGNGPDVIACVEVESVRAGELLRTELNRRLKAAGKGEKLQYTQMLMEDLNGGRHIAPCVITRVNADPQNITLSKPRRILETHLSLNGHDLCVMVAHWTSQLQQKDGSDGDSGRDKYATTIRERFAELSGRNPDTDFLVCGDFNDVPESEPVYGALGAVGDPNRLKPSATAPLLLNLMHGKDPAEYGTLWYNGKPLIYDHICVSAGMLDERGWSVEPQSVQTYTQGLVRAGATRREPWRFEHPNKEMRDADRGYADHFPVIVKLKVEAK